MEKRIKKTYICKDIRTYRINSSNITGYTPEVGDLGIFEVVKLGKHERMQGEFKRNITILPGDWIMAAFGTRYATAQFEGYVPANCDTELHILGAGGTVGVVTSMHQKFIDVGPTTLRFIGQVTNRRGHIINTKKIKKHSLKSFSGEVSGATQVILSVGSSMDSGKTTTAAHLVRGLKKKGYKVAFVKLTGTVYTKDCDLNYDLGADIAVDFGEFGFPSTYMCSESELLDLYESLVLKASVLQPDYIIMEIADGLYQRETKILLKNEAFMKTIAGVIFSAGDSLAAINGVNLLHSWRIKPFAVSGLLTASPLLMAEVKANLRLPVYTIGEITEQAEEILGRNTGALIKVTRRVMRAAS